MTRFITSTSKRYCRLLAMLTMRSVITELFLKSLPEGTTELMCHPGYADEALQKSATRLQASRPKELEIFTDARIRNLVASQGIRLIDYGYVTQEA